MAKGIITTLYSNGLLDVYNSLNTLGFVTDTIGTPTANQITFTSPLVESGTGIRMTLYGIGTSSNNGIGLELGTVTDGVYVSKRVLYVDKGNSDDNDRMAWNIIYDNINMYLILARTGVNKAKGELFFFCKLDTELKIVGAMTDLENHCNGIFPADVADMTTIYKLISFKETIVIGSNYIEQDIRVRKGTNEVVMNGVNPAKIVGLSNVAILATDVLVINSDWVLFSQIYGSYGNSLDTNYYTYFKADLV